ncbi:hypothetical protein J4E90_003844 [Alternaria incomplexa]|uniref:uncharacterized protein n=1 Tax=Alternaria incomplexa TaxID=1187928 RepID=UPI00221E8173|nr:uncharacterized protein J4E90_003844 [Alternaria incomplexa]XP_051298320.1 uncharacterized protein J4E86_009899 [Alternaria arbusti]KAI4917337.1 hypothetical protein J4E90_003844 [Alternaria incomplexa]KAI4942952.1 hypothetical protein J4E86_009899 [Alternaria arbusti]
MSSSHSPERARSASPSASPVQSDSPHADANKKDSGVQDRELTQDEKLRISIAESYADGSLFEQDISLLTDDERRARRKALERLLRSEHACLKNLENVVRAEYAMVEAAKERADALWAEVARLEEEVAILEARNAQKDEDVAAPQSTPEAAHVSNS